MPSGRFRSPRRPQPCPCSSPAARAARSHGRSQPVGGEGCIRLSRIFAVAGICVTLSASIAVGLYELLLHLEH